MAESASGCTSSRTTGSKRRWRSSSSTIARLLSPSFSPSPSSTSASRQTRNRLALATIIPGKSRSALARITWSRLTNTHSDEPSALTRSHWGRSVGSFTRTSTASPLTGSSSWNAHDVERFET